MMHDMHDEQMELEKKDEVEQPNYAGFWIRFLAVLLDSVAVIILLIIGVAIFYVVLEAIDASGVTAGIFTTIFVIALVIWYFILMPASKKQGTWGKQICKIYIGDKDGERISVGRSFLRFLGTYLSSIFYIGYIMVAFTEKKQGLHDLIASTYVYKKVIEPKSEQ